MQVDGLRPQVREERDLLDGARGDLHHVGADLTRHVADLHALPDGAEMQAESVLHVDDRVVRHGVGGQVVRVVRALQRRREDRELAGERADVDVLPRGVLEARAAFAHARSDQAPALERTNVPVLVG